jgi:hypothetical protein
LVGVGVVLSEEGWLVRVVDDLQRGCEVCGGGHVVDRVPAAIAVGPVQPPSVEAVASLSEGSRGPLRAVVWVPGCPALRDSHGVVVGLVFQAGLMLGVGGDPLPAPALEVGEVGVRGDPRPWRAGYLADHAQGGSPGPSGA